MARRDRNWPERCTLMGCPKPDLRPHHHHMVRGYLNSAACQCPYIDRPGTRPT